MNRSVTFGTGMAAGLLLAGAIWIGVEGAAASVDGAAREGASRETLAQAGAAAAKATPGKNTSRIVLENARVRVKEAIFQPGVTQPGMHTHDLAHVGVVIEGGTLVFRSPDGKSETMTLTAGGVGYRDANVTHEPVNTGKTPVRVIEVELK